MEHTGLTLDLLSDELAVCRLPLDAAIPNWAWSGELTSITSTDDELSVVCATDPVPDDIEHTAGWRAFKIRGPLDFDLVGILAGLSSTLAEAGVSIFAISTYETDYVLVRAGQLETAAESLERAGIGCAEPIDVPSIASRELRFERSEFRAGSRELRGQSREAMSPGSISGRFAPNDKQTVTLSEATSEVAESKGPLNQRRAS